MDRRLLKMSGAEDQIQSVVSFSQSVLLGSFALLLTAHRTEIMDRNSELDGGGESQSSSGFREVEEDASESDYDPPSVR